MTKEEAIAKCEALDSEGGIVHYVNCRDGKFFVCSIFWNMMGQGEKLSLAQNGNVFKSRDEAIKKKEEICKVLKQPT